MFFKTTYIYDENEIILVKMYQWDSKIPFLYTNSFQTSTEKMRRLPKTYVPTFDNNNKNKIISNNYFGSSGNIFLLTR